MSALHVDRSDALERRNVHLSAHAAYLVAMRRVDDAVVEALIDQGLDSRTARSTSSGDMISTIAGTRILWRIGVDGHPIVLTMIGEDALLAS